MASSKEQQILDKIKIVITQQFETADAAFAYFDKDSDGKLNRSEITELLKKAEINRFLQGVVTAKLVEKFDESDNEFIEWSEFEEAVAKLV